MRIAIVEDQDRDKRELMEMLERYFARMRVLVEYECFCSGEAFFHAFQPGRFQIIFLDIYMEGADGMTVARRLREQDRDCRLIFFTTSSDHAVSSYKVRASYYLTKPVAYELLYDALEVCAAGLLADSQYLETCAGQTPLKVLYRDIFYVDCQNKAVMLHTASGILAVSDSFGQVSQRLMEDERFYESCRVVVVNLDWVVQMPGGDVICGTTGKVEDLERLRVEFRSDKIWYDSLAQLDEVDGKMRGSYVAYDGDFLRILAGKMKRGVRYFFRMHCQGVYCNVLQVRIPEGGGPPEISLEGEASGDPPPEDPFRDPSTGDHGGGDRYEQDFPPLRQPASAKTSETTDVRLPLVEGYASMKMGDCRLSLGTRWSLSVFTACTFWWRRS